MKQLLKSPVFNAVCIGLFTAFYSVVFLVFMQSADFSLLMSYGGDSAFFTAWSKFLLAKSLTILICIMVVITAALIVLLLFRRKPYDEYHSTILKVCLAIASVFTLAAIGVFYALVLIQPEWLIGKLTLFIVVHWVSVTVCNLVFVIACKQK